MVSTMLLWNPANLPQRFFDPLSQGFKGLTEAERSRFYIGVGEHKMIDQVGKRLSCNRDAQIFHMGKIRLGSFSWGMDLFKDDVFFWPMQDSPSGNMAPQCAILCRAIAIRMPLAQQ